MLLVLQDQYYPVLFWQYVCCSESCFFFFNPLMHKWVKNDPVRLFSCKELINIPAFPQKTCYWNDAITFFLPFKISAVFVLLPEASTNGSKMTCVCFRQNFMGIFDPYQLWMSGIYILWPCDKQVWPTDLLLFWGEMLCSNVQSIQKHHHRSFFSPVCLLRSISWRRISL